MIRCDRIAVRFALLSLALRCKGDPGGSRLTTAAFEAGWALMDPLLPDDGLRLAFERARTRWHDGRYDVAVLRGVAADLMRAVERDSWPADRQRVDLHG